MRLLNEQLRHHRVETLDGIKVWLGDEAWVLIRPDPDRPVLHIDAEGESPLAAQETLEKYIRIVEGLREE